MSDFSTGRLVLGLDHSGLSECDFLGMLNLEIRSYWLDGDLHVVDDDSLLTRSHMAEGSGPSLESLEAEGEAVLAGLEAIALIDHNFILCEHISCLVVGHLVVFVPRVSYVFRSVVIASVIFGLRVRNGDWFLRI